VKVLDIVLRLVTLLIFGFFAAVGIYAWVYGGVQLQFTPVGIAVMSGSMFLANLADLAAALIVWRVKGGR
jgi:hypothetical protein